MNAYKGCNQGCVNTLGGVNCTCNTAPSRQPIIVSWYVIHCIILHVRLFCIVTVLVCNSLYFSDDMAMMMA